MKQKRRRLTNKAPGECKHGAYGPNCRDCHGTPAHFFKPRAHEDFQDWIKKVPRDILENYLMDLLWKNTTFTESELHRAFLLEMYKDINMVPRPLG